MGPLAATALSVAALASTAAAATGGAQLTFTQLGGSGFTFTGQFFPKIDAATGAVVDFDARVSYVDGGNVFTVTVLDRRAYTSAQEIATGTLIGTTCLASSQLPPVASLLEAFRHPQVISTDELDCDEGEQPVAFTFSDNQYAFCATTESIPATGGDAKATVALLLANSEATPSRGALATDALQLSSCSVLYTDDDLTRQQSQRELKAEADCTCKGGKKACLFIHGMGLKEDGAALDDYPKCWGDIKTQAACCSSMKFMQMDTVGNAWYGDYLAKKVCETAISMAPAGSNPMALEGLAFVGHSMGNLVVANAELKGYCALGATSKWISLSGPFLGSKSANFALGACSSGNSVTVGALTALGLCPVNATIASLPYINSDRSNPTIDALYEKAGAIYRKKVTSNLCGVSPSGLTSTRSIRYGLLGSLSGHATSENDGAVHILSCQAGLDAAKYSTTWSGGNFYKADINHGDSSFVTGDGAWGDSRKPIKWFNCQF